MSTSTSAIRTSCVAVVIVLGACRLAAAQEPVRSFDRLNTRLKVGDAICVTDAQGREITGKVRSFAPDALTLSGDPGSIPADRVRLITQRRGSRMGTGALLGSVPFAVFGGLLGAAAGSFDTSDPHPVAVAAAGAVLLGALGAGLGAGVGALLPGRKQVVYRAPGAGGATHDGTGARLSIAPVMTPRAKGVAVRVSF